MPVRILATADIHVGRRPTKVPDSEDARRFSCARMWRAIVECAIREQVDLVTLSGDIVDHDNRFFEATGPLEAGLTKLAAAGIHTYAVAGNHDYDVLPRIVDAVGTAHFHLLGRDGRWEQADFVRDGHPLLRIHGWSFPASHVLTSPLASWDASTDGDLPVIGLLHADLDVLDSRYAPVSRAELESRDLTMWLLGHVHRPQLFEASAGPAVLYPGSPQAMDPGETGRHGPWLIEIHGRHNATASPIALSKVRYEELTVDLSDKETKDEFDAHLIDCTGEILSNIAADGGPVEYVSLRIALTGRTHLCGQLDGFAEPLREQFERTTGQITARIDRVTNNALPLIDLEELALKHDPPGILAQTLLQLQSERTDDGLAALLHGAHQKQREVSRAGAYASISDGTVPDVEVTRQCLIRQGTLLLDRLLAQERST
jgi:exonuclease SbcD